MPDVGTCIWVYELEKARFQKIEVNNPNNVRLSIMNFWEHDDKIFAVSIGLNQIIQINIKEKKIENYYSLGNDREMKISRGVKAGNKLYIVSAVTNQVYQFDLETKEVMVHTIPDIEGGFHTISHDGSKFWLSGYKKEIYVWDQRSNAVKIINQFPKHFGIYNFAGNGDELLDCGADLYDTPTFIESLTAGAYVWYIPFLTNKILYIDKNTYEVHSLEMEEENETENSLKARCMDAKYLVEYVAENRFIGLYSFKKYNMLEIDAFNRTAEWKEYSFSPQCWRKIIDICKRQGNILYERRSLDRMIFKLELFNEAIE